MDLSISISPCPNDTFIFYGLISGKISIPDVKFIFNFADIEELNSKVLSCNTDICKISYAIANRVSNNYDFLRAGSALGKGVGPVLITYHNENFNLLPKHTIVLPGENTTAHLLFKYFYPNYYNKTFMLFSEIENRLIEKKYDAGVIIHENRFTYHEKGLTKIVDLGEKWEKETNLPIPLGGIVIKKEIPKAIKQKINNAIKLSIEYANKNIDETLNFCKSYAQEMQLQIMLNHINLYVNEYSIDIGKDGEKAIFKLLEASENKNSCNFADKINFID